jgi:alanine racemase
MDSVCADVTDVADVEADDVYTLLGQDGRERIAVEELARLRRTIPNEVFCALGGRLPRMAV